MHNQGPILIQLNKVGNESGALSPNHVAAWTAGALGGQNSSGMYRQADNGLWSLTTKLFQAGEEREYVTEIIYIFGLEVIISILNLCIFRLLIAIFIIA